MIKLLLKLDGINVWKYKCVCTGYIAGNRQPPEEHRHQKFVQVVTLQPQRFVVKVRILSIEYIRTI